MAKTTFEQVIDELKGLGTYKEAFNPSIRVYVDMLNEYEDFEESRYQKLSARIKGYVYSSIEKWEDELKEVVNGKKLVVDVNIVLDDLHLKKLRNDILSYAKELGLTPRSIVTDNKPKQRRKIR